MKIHANITELIGGTPLVELTALARDLEARVCVKLESFNPMSLKDRPALAMIEGAERSGRLSSGGTIVEATSGNMGLALTVIGRKRGYRVILCMSELMSVERQQLLRALGAEVILTPKEKGTKGAREQAQRIAREIEGSFYIDQHANPDNARAHEEATSEEIWNDTEGRVDVIVAGLGSGGTLTGIARRLKPRKPALELIAVEPKEAPMISEGRYHPHRIMGTSPGFIPAVLDRQCLDHIELVSEEEAFRECSELALEEGILVGISAGAVVHACLRLARQPNRKGQLIVGILADSAERYLSVEGFLPPPQVDGARECGRGN